MTNAPEDVAAAGDGVADRDPGPGQLVPAGSGGSLRERAVLRPSASLDPFERAVPTWTDPTVRRASDVIGGPMGRHASVGRLKVFTPLRVCLIFAILALIGGWLYKSACIQQAPDGNGGFVLDQSGQRPWITGCYNDIVPLYGSHSLDAEKLPYTTEYKVNGHLQATGTPDRLVPYVEYPVVTGYFMYAISVLNSKYQHLAANVGLPRSLDVADYFTITAIVLGMLYLVAVAATARLAGRRIWDTAIMCLSPLLIVQAFTNWDLLALTLTAAAMWAWSKSRWRPDRPGSMAMAGWPLLAGVLLGLGTSTKLYPLLLLGPLLILSVRAGRIQGWILAAAAAAVTWLAVNVPVMLSDWTGWYEFIRLNTSRPAEYDSWYAIFQSLSGSSAFAAPDGGTPSLLNNLSLALFVLACVGIGWFAWSVQRRPRFAQVAFLMVAAFLLTNKVWSPQYSLWLLPLVTLALPRWRPVLAWQFSEAACWILLMLQFDEDTAKGLSIYPFDVAALIRDALLLTLVVKVIREAIRPENDLVRQARQDDPTGGLIEGAPDRFRIPSVPDLWSALRQPRVAAPAVAEGPTSP